MWSAPITNTNFDLSKNKVGDSFYGCHKCGVRLEPDILAHCNQCPNCLGTLMRYTVTEEDLKPPA